MTRYRMDDGSIVDTDKAKEVWAEETRFDGRNMISVNTGSQWEHEELYRSSKGRYYLIQSSDWQGSGSSAQFIDEEDAANWLILNRHDLPEDLQHFAEQIVE